MDIKEHIIAIEEQAACTSGMVKYLGGILSEIDKEAGQISEEVGLVSDRSRFLLRKSEKQAEAIEGLADRMDALAHTADMAAGRMESNGADGEKIKEHGESALKKVRACSGEIEKTLELLTDAAESSSPLSSILRLMEGVAREANILAFNAAVAGKGTEQRRNGGLTAVLDESRQLASNSAKAAEEAASLLDETLNFIKEAESRSQAMMKALKAAAEEIEKMAAAAESVSSSVKCRVQDSREICKGMEQAAKEARRGSAAAKESIADSRELSAQIETLKKMVGTLKPNKEATPPKAHEEKTESAAI